VTENHRVFVSSVQKELASERRAVHDFVEGDALLSRFFEVFLFEDLPASGQRPDELYLAEIDQSAVYIGLFGNHYGHEDDSGVSPTEAEFDRATFAGKERLIFVKGSDDKSRHPKMQALINKASGQLNRRRFSSIEELTSQIYASLVEYLTGCGAIQSRPFDAIACPDATFDDISQKKLTEFLERAKSARGYVLGPDTSMEKALIHLNLLDGTHPKHAAILLFGKKPQRFLISSEVKCLHFHGTQVCKPIPSYQIYRGTIFDLVNQAVDFVMSKIDRAVGTRSEGPVAPVTYELPREAVAEAIVNAVAHRDYASKASVQVMLFSDRLEVWNPGHLPAPLTIESLRVPHASIPHNPLIAEPLFLTRYIEKAGTGTLDMIALCEAAGLPTPGFSQEGGQFIQVLWRDWLTDIMLEELGIDERQREVVQFLRGHGRITNTDYQKAFGVSKPTASRNLNALLQKQVLIKVGQTGKGTYYILNLQGLTKGSSRSQTAHCETNKEHRT